MYTAVCICFYCMATDAVRSAGNTAVQRPDGVMSWPFSLIPDTTYCQPADLTQIGVEQHLQNGQILRQVTLHAPHLTQTTTEGCRE